MPHLIATNITHDFLTSQGGLAIGKKIESLFKLHQGSPIEISFEGVTNVSPSFVNGAFLYLIDNYGGEYFRNHVKVVHSASDVAKTMGDAVRSYLQHQKAFYDKLKTNKIYFASDNSNAGQMILSELKRTSSAHGFSFAVNPSSNNFTPHTLEVIKHSDAVIAVLGSSRSDLLDDQIQAAVNANKPCIILQSRNINIRVRSAMHQHIQVIYFDDADYLSQLHKLNLLIAQHKRDVMAHGGNFPTKNNDAAMAIGAFLVIALLAAFLIAAIGEKNEKEPN